MTKLPLILIAMAALAAPPALAQLHPAAATQAAVPTDLASVEGITVKGKRCTLAQPGCSCRERDLSCVLAVAEDMRLYFPREYRAMAVRCLRDDTLMARYQVETANSDATGSHYLPGYTTQVNEPGVHKAFCDKAYADARAADRAAARR